MPPDSPRFGTLSRPVVEACVESIDAAELARSAGADRVELCAALDVGGTTPSMETVSACVARVGIPVHVMIRPRGGGFVYDAAELARMERDIEAARAAGASAVVLGVLCGDGRIDVARTKVLVERAHPLPVTIHKAFDGARGCEEALEGVVAAGAARVLTSGFASAAVEGIGALSRLVSASRGRVEVMAGGGVRAANVERIVRETGVRAIHARCDPAGGDAFARLVVAVDALTGGGAA